MPFQLDSMETSEEVRLKYRYLDLEEMKCKSAYAQIKSNALYA